MRSSQGLGTTRVRIRRLQNSIYTDKFRPEHAYLAIRGLMVDERSRGRGFAPAYARNSFCLAFSLLLHLDILYLPLLLPGWLCQSCFHSASQAGTARHYVSHIHMHDRSSEMPYIGVSCLCSHYRSAYCFMSSWVLGIRDLGHWYGYSTGDDVELCARVTASPLEIWCELSHEQSSASCSPASPLLQGKAHARIQSIRYMSLLHYSPLKEL